MTKKKMRNRALNADYLVEPLKTGKPYLGNMDVVQGLVRGYLVLNFELIEKVKDGLYMGDQTYQIAMDETSRIAKIFCGLDADYTPIGAWNGQPLADAILKVVDPSVFKGADLHNSIQVIENFLGFLLGQVNHIFFGSDDLTTDEQMLACDEVIMRATRLLVTGIA